MIKCEVCQTREGMKGSIIAGDYYSSICHTCYLRLTAHEAASSGQARYNRDRDFEEHEADIIQPYDGSGKASPEFIRLYPETAAKMFSQDEMNEANRS